ncbi:MAG: hypothetical protein QOI09_1009, partial [Chloroflexota bacterium]|nr:hypothetical protein [Chloroflexota bacterium]
PIPGLPFTRNETLVGDNDRLGYRIGGRGGVAQW